jgi:Anti-sigma-K factor rskA, C-terminal
MSKRPDFHELVGGDVSPEERADLERIDSLLRAAGPPPAEIPSSLTRRVEQIGARPLPTWRRTALALALAATLAAIFFGIGRWTEADEVVYRAAIPMQATAGNPQAGGLIKVGEKDAQGNWKLRLEVKGLPPLSGDRYYVLWLAKDGKYAATCGSFNVRGDTVVEMTASYRLSDFDAWVVSEARENAPWLLTARI